MRIAGLHLNQTAGPPASNVGAFYPNSIILKVRTRSCLYPAEMPGLGKRTSRMRNRTGVSLPQYFFSFACMAAYPSAGP